MLSVGTGRIGVDDGTRTHDDRDHNPGLYQLSYAHHCLSLCLASLPWQARSSRHRPGRPDRAFAALRLSTGQTVAAHPTELRPPLFCSKSILSRFFPNRTKDKSAPIMITLTRIGADLARLAGLEPATLGLAYPLPLSRPRLCEFVVWTISSPSQAPHV